jgi:hypothetical protein
VRRRGRRGQLYAHHTTINATKDAFKKFIPIGKYRPHSDALCTFKEQEEGQEYLPMLGYTMKDDGKPHHRHHARNVPAETLRAARLTYEPVQWKCDSCTINLVANVDVCHVCGCDSVSPHRPGSHLGLAEYKRVIAASTTNEIPMPQSQRMAATAAASMAGLTSARATVPAKDGNGLSRGSLMINAIRDGREKIANGMWR